MRRIPAFTSDMEYRVVTEGRLKELQRIKFIEGEMERMTKEIHDYQHELDHLNRR